MKFVQTCLCILICLAMQAFGQDVPVTDLPPAVVGQDYTGAVTFKAKISIPFHLDLSGKLPDGLTLNPDGTIQGKATKAGATRFGVFLSDASGPVTSGIFNLQVNAPSAGAPAPAKAKATPDCPGTSIARPRLTSRLAEGVTKISGTAQPTSTACTTKVRVWLVPNESEDMVSKNDSVEMLAAHDGDAVVTAQGTWSMELDQALDSGQFIQVEQYFESDQKDAEGKSQTKVTTLFTAAAEAMATTAALEKTPSLRRRQRRQTSAQKISDSPCAAVVSDDQMSKSDYQLLCGQVRQLAEKFVSVPQPTQGVADWGRVRAYFTSGMLLSHDQGSFSNASMFLAFTLDKSWLLPDYFIDEKVRHHLFSFGFNSFFETRLTSVPVSTCTQTGSATTTSGSQPTACQNNGSSQTLDTFLTSRKTARMAAGVYAPMLTTRWHYQGAPNALYWAPLIKVGFDTPTESFDTTATSAQSQGATAAVSPTPAAASPVNGDRFYNNYSFGVRLGHFKLSSTRDQAPQDISHLDVTVGRFSNLESLVNTPTSPVTNILGRQRLWRFQLEGLLKIPNTPAVVGFSANIGQQTFGADNLVKPANDDLRFLFGTKFDVGKLVSKIKGL